MQISKEYAARAWILEDLRQHLTTDELDEVILFAREAGYLDADAKFPDGTSYFDFTVEKISGLINDPPHLKTMLHVEPESS